MCLASGKLVWNAHPLATTSRQTCNEIEQVSEYVEFYLQATRKWWWKETSWKRKVILCFFTQKCSTKWQFFYGLIISEKYEEVRKTIYIFLLYFQPLKN